MFASGTSTIAMADPALPTAPRDMMATMPAKQTAARTRGRREPARKTPRHFPARYKIDILTEYDTLNRAGKTALLQRENLRASQISRWREQVYAAALEALGAEPGSQPVRRIHVSESVWQQATAAAAAADLPMRPEQLVRAFLRYYAGLTDFLPPRPSRSPSPPSAAAD